MSHSTDPSELNSTLKRLLDRSVFQHVYRAEETLLLVEVIQDNAWAIDTKGFTPLFHVLLMSLADMLTTCITKMLDTPSRRHPEQRSIPALLQFVDDHSEKLTIRNRRRLEALLKDADVTTHGVDDSTLIRATVNHYRNTLPKPASFWFRRDKRVAHSEDVPLPAGFDATWLEAKKLIRYGQQLAGLLGETFDVCHYLGNDGTFMASKGASRAANDLTSLLELADLVDRDQSARQHLDILGYTVEFGTVHTIWKAMVHGVPERLVGVGSSLEEAKVDVTQELNAYLHSIAEP